MIEHIEKAIEYNEKMGNKAEAERLRKLHAELTWFNREY